jgi:small subunit ribosomal protein S1
MLMDVNYLWVTNKLLLILGISNEDSFAVGTIHNGEISEIVDKGATVEFGDDIVAFPTRHLEKKMVKLKKGESADFKVIEFNKEFKELCISHCYLPEEEEKKAVLKYSSNSSTNAPAATLGDNNDMY